MSNALASIGERGDLQQQIAAEFAEIRQLDNELNGTIHTFMREVVLPSAREIGRRLLRLQGLFPKGTRGRYGSKSDFYPACQQLAGLSKSSVRRYIKVHENWDWLIGHMLDLPEGAAPITSLRAAVAAIEGRGRALKPAAESVDVEAASVAILPTGTTAERVVSDVRRKALPPFEKLLGALKGHPRQGEVLGLLNHLLQILDQLEVDEVFNNIDADAFREDVEREPEPFFSSPLPVAPQPPAPAPEEEEAPAKAQANKGLLLKRYPLTPEGAARFEDELVAAGSGTLLARKLEVNRTSIIRHRKRLKEALA